MHNTHDFAVDSSRLTMSAPNFGSTEPPPGNNIPVSQGDDGGDGGCALMPACLLACNNNNAFSLLFTLTLCLSLHSYHIKVSGVALAGIIGGKCFLGQ